MRPAKGRVMRTTRRAHRRAVRMGLLGGLLSLLVPGVLIGGALPANGASSSSVGVTSNTIKVGITYVDLSTVQQFVHGLNEGNFKAAYQAVINNINNSGGINGRKIQPYYEGVVPVGSAAPQAACTALTQDDQVFAVMGFFQGNDPLCYVSLHSTPVIGGTMTTQQLAQAKAAWFTPTPIQNVLEPAVATVAAKEGLFKNKKVAVVAQSDAPPGIMAAVLTALRKSGVKPVATATILVNASDLAASQQSIVGVISQKFQSAGANVVVAVGNAGQSWPTAMANQTYQPKLVATSYSALSTYASTSGKGIDGAFTAFTKPASVGSRSIGWSDPALQRCVRLVKAAGQPVSSPLTNPDAAHLTYVAVGAACQNLALFTAIAKKAGKNLNDATFLHAGNTLGPVLIPGQGTGVYSKATPAGVFPLYLYHYDASTQQLVANPTPSGTVG
jgi:hypothetical protein